MRQKNLCTTVTLTVRYHSSLSTVTKHSNKATDTFHKQAIVDGDLIFYRPAIRRFLPRLLYVKEKCQHSTLPTRDYRKRRFYPFSACNLHMAISLTYSQA